MYQGALPGAIPANVSVIVRPMVMAGLAKLVELGFGGRGGRKPFPTPIAS